MVSFSSRPQRWVRPLAGAFVFALLIGGCPPESIQAVDDLFGTNFSPPTVSEIAPASGPASGGTEVTIVGTNFEGDTGILFGGVAATHVQKVNDTLLRATSPTGTAGMVDLTILSADRQQLVIEDAFEYIAPPEPPAKPAPAIASVSPARVPTLGGTRVRVIGEGFEPGTIVLFGAFLGTEVEVLNEKELLVTVPAQADGDVEVVVRTPDGVATTASEPFSYVAIDQADAEIIRLLEQQFPGGPRLVSAVALNNTAFRVTFSEPVRKSDVQDVQNYSIVIPGGGMLLIDANSPTLPMLSNDQTSVDIVSLSQADAMYELTMTNVRDLAGNRLAAPEVLVNPAVAEFRGIAPNKIQKQIDTDGDGFADWFEMLGWSITIELANGQRSEAYVTSDPYNPDTDGDGLNDGEENRLSLDPRTDDTDADQVSDWEETRLLLSDPADQDTDDDGFADKTEQLFQTSVTLADTDGDQLTDFDEIVRRNRNPRLADLPLPQIRIGTMNLSLDERFTYTDERGTERSIERSSQTSYTQSNTRTFSQSSTRSNEATNTFSQGIKVGAEGEIGKGKAGVKVGGEINLGFGQQRSRGYSSTVSRESSNSAQEQYASGQSSALAMSQRQAVTRSIDGANMSLDLTIVNAGDLAFTISNLEVSARVMDPQQRDRFLPIATLLPSSGNNEFNLGPFLAQRGPFIFENSEIFPSLVQDLLREPRAIIYEVANYDLTDELGRNFAFTSEEINDLTAGLTIDFGDGRVETYRVATASTFTYPCPDDIPTDDPRLDLDGDGILDCTNDRVTGRPRGITMRDALVDIIGLNEVVDDPSIVNRMAPDQADLRDSYGVETNDDGEQILTRIRDVQTESNPSNPAARFWVVLSNDDIPANTNFGDLKLRPGVEYALWYVQDTDDDGLFAREEFLAGSSDLAVDTDDDGISDFDEVKTGWVVATAGSGRRVYSDPGTPDSDGDLVPDALERRLGLDPRNRDTDGDALRDDIEIEGYETVLFDGDLDPTNNPVVQVEPYTDAVIIEPRSGGDGTASTVADPNSDDEQLIAVGQPAGAGDAIIGPGPDGIIDTLPSGDEFQSTLGPAIIATSAGVAASEAQGDDIQIIPVGDPVATGDVVVRAGPNGELDTDPTGNERIRVPHRALFATDPAERDTDADSVFDGREELLGSRPNQRDADSVLDSDFDGLTDKQENDGWTVTYTDVNGNPITLDVQSDPRDPDTDGDGLPDALEFALLSHPDLRDTDMDGLSDLAEYDPNDSADFYDDTRVEVFEESCFEAEDCVFEPARSPVKSNLLAQDTDGDSRTDGAEVNTSWLVDVDGQAAFEVFSNPLKADEDGDGLNDAEERMVGTAPAIADTDMDMVLDGDEVDNVVTDDFGNTVSSDPLTPDRLVLAEYTRGEVLDDWDNGDGQNAGEFRWDFDVVIPGQGTFTLTSSNNLYYGVDDDGLPNDLPLFVGTQNSMAFVLPEDGTFNFAGELDEDDPAPNENENASFNEQISLQAGSFGINSFVHEFQTIDGQRARVSATYQIFR